MPAGQSAQTDAPVVLPYLPASHVKQTVDPGPEYFPAMHTVQKSGDDAQRKFNDVPAVQLAQTEAPTVSAYLPPSQGRQVSKEVAPGVGE